MIDIEQADLKARQLALAMFSLSQAISEDPSSPSNPYQERFCSFLTEDIPFSLEERLGALVKAMEVSPSPQTVQYAHEEEEKIESYSRTLAGLADACDQKITSPSSQGRQTTDQTPHVDFNDYRVSFEKCLRRPSTLSVRQKLDVLENIIKTHHRDVPHAQRSAQKFVEVFDIANSQTKPPAPPETLVNQARAILQVLSSPLSAKNLKASAQPEVSSPPLFKNTNQNL